MVRRQIEARGVRDGIVLAALRAVPRHEFIPPALGEQAYEDHAVALADGQTVSQPYIVALMTELLGLRGGERVLEIGTGSGYQAAVLAEIAADVYSVEIRAALHEHSRALLERLAYRNVHTLCADGRRGWPEHAPYDGIVVTAAAADDVPEALIEQLADGARLVAPIGVGDQELVVLERRGTKIIRRGGTSVRFVPLIDEESLSA